MRRRYVAAIAVAALTVSGVVAAGRVGDDPPAAPGRDRPAAVATRPCVFAPMVSDDDVTAPDGTYIATLLDLDRIGRTVSLFIDDGGAGYSFSLVPVSPEVAAMKTFTKGSSPAVTVERGTVVKVDLDRVRWDTDAIRRKDPCTEPPPWPTPACRSSPLSLPSSWPAGLDGNLGTVADELPGRIAATLAAWGIPTRPDDVALDNRWCGATIGASGHRSVRLGLAPDGHYVVRAVVDDPVGSNPNLRAGRFGAALSVVLVGNVPEQWIGGSASVQLTCGAGSFEASGPWAPTGILVPVDDPTVPCVGRFSVTDRAGVASALVIEPLQVDP